MEHFPAKVTVNLEHLTANTQCIKHLVGDSVEIMGIVKANAYGHGLLEAAHAILKGGATWLGVAKISEALELRKYLNSDTEHCSHQNTRIFSWIYGPDAPYEEMLKARLDLSVTTLWEIDKIATAAAKLGAPDNFSAPNIHLEVDTGFSRNGFTRIEGLYEKALEKIKYYQDRGLINLVGIWSHLAVADQPNEAAATKKTMDAACKFEDFHKELANYGLDVKYKHIAASASTLLNPELHYNLVRPGIALYGCSPNPEQINISKYNIKPALKLEVQMNNVKYVAAGEGISYGHKYITENDTYLGIVPLGYADGILRCSGGTNSSATAIKPGAPVYVPSSNKLARIVGRVCMDQFMIDLGPETNAKAGDWVTLFGFNEGEPSIDEWAKAGDTISYEILTKISKDASIKYLDAPQTMVIKGLPITD